MSVPSGFHGIVHSGCGQRFEDPYGQLDSLSQAVEEARATLRSANDVIDLYDEGDWSLAHWSILQEVKWTREGEIGALDRLLEAVRSAEDVTAHRELRSTLEAIVERAEETDAVESEVFFAAMTR